MDESDVKTKKRIGKINTKKTNGESGKRSWESLKDFIIHMPLVLILKGAFLFPHPVTILLKVFFTAFR